MKKNGFTLVEMMIVLAIFSVTTVVIVDIFMMASRAERRTLAIQKIQSDARYSLEAMSREIKMDMIDYDYYGGTIASVPTDALALRDADDNQIIFKKSSENCPVGTTNCLVVSLDGGTNWESITAPGINVEDLKFYIDPTVDSFKMNAGNTYDSDSQPRVTIILRIKGVGGRPDEQHTVYLQTTVSNRIYKR
jgi:prepilin-type N-terminal cleavage/methylation domain-containing protein